MGLQGNSSAWVSYSGRCYLVAYEHLREAVGDEIVVSAHKLREALNSLKSTAEVEIEDESEDEQPRFSKEEAKPQTQI